MALPDAVEAWVADLERRGKSGDHVYNMRLLMTRMAEACHWPTLGSIRSDSLTTWLADLQAGRACLPCQARTHHEKTLTGSTLNKYLGTARAFVRWCRGQRPLPWLSSDPLEGIQPAEHNTRRREKRALRLEELQRLKEVSGIRWVVYLTAVLTG